MILNSYYGGVVKHDDSASETVNVINDSGELEGNLIVDIEAGEMVNEVESNGSTDTSYLHLPRYVTDDYLPRAKTIMVEDFEDGDVLIYYVDRSRTYGKAVSNKSYTDEDGMYAYIYLNGRFIGKNQTGTKQQRNEFTPEYYNTITGGGITCRKDPNNTSKCENNVDFAGHLYAIGTQSIRTSLVDENYYDFLNYQTLSGKDYFIILRPSQYTEKIGIDTTYKKDETNKTIYNVASNTKTNTFLNSISSSGVSNVLTNNGVSVQTTDTIKTGYKLKTIFGIETDSPLNYKIAVLGDTLGTGYADKASAKNIAKHIVNGNVITGSEYLKAADYNDDGNIKMNDVVKLMSEIE
jgi:hypothetical protein